MGIYRFGFKMLKADFRQSMFYLTSIIFVVAVIFNSLNIMCNDSIITQSGFEENICSSIVFVLVMSLILFTFFTNSYFISNKKKELAFSALSGASLNKLSKMIFFENFILGIIGSFIGLIIGIALEPIFILIMHKITGIQGDLWTISIYGLISTVGVIFFQVALVSFGDLMHLSSKEIIELFNENKQIYQPDARVVKFPKIIFLIVYLIPITMLFINVKYIDPLSLTFINIIFSYYGTQGLVRYYIPEKILKLKNKKYKRDKINLMVLSNLHYSLRKLDILIVILSIVSVTLTCATGLFKSSLKIETISIISYVIMLVLMAICIIYKFIVEIENRKYMFKQLNMIGYTKKQVRKIILQEIKFFYGIVIAVPLVHLLIYVALFNKIGFVPIQLAGVLILIYIAIFILAAVISAMRYKKVVLVDF